MSGRIVRSLVVLLAAAGLALGCTGRGRYNPDTIRGAGDGVVTAGSPQDCGAAAGFGTVGPGTAVVLHRHRPVSGDRNWVAAMGSYLGRSTRVTGRAGKDPSGCPVVTVSADDGRYFWRVRDLGVPAPGLGPGGGDAVPQRCDQDPETADYGLVQPGASVVLWRHRRLEGDSNWVDEMSAHVSAEARVTRLAGVDGSGCPVVNVDVDGGEWVWRVRDMTLVAPALPQRCGRDAGRGHGPLAVGTTVRLGRHRPVRGEASWLNSMEQYVGRLARITSLGPPDDQGCPVVHVDADQGARTWRVRDLALVDGEAGRGALSAGGVGMPRPSGGGSSAGIPEECGQAFGGESYGAIREGSRIVLGRHRPVDGDDNWADEMGSYVGREATVTRLSGSDAAGCPGVRVDVDGGEWFWRIRDTTLAP